MKRNENKTILLCYLINVLLKYAPPSTERNRMLQKCKSRSQCITTVVKYRNTSLVVLGFIYLFQIKEFTSL